MNNPKIMLVAGEASGDQHAARLVQAIRDRLPQAKFFGIGGEALARQGMRLACHAEDLAVIGLTEVLHKIPTIWRALQALWRYLRDERPNLVILVDFPDFNFLVLRLAKRFRVPVMYYISPQVWAWRRGRVNTISRLVNRMVVIFPFEEEFYRQHGVAVTYVGHPLLETLPALPPRPQLRERFGIQTNELAVALLPGSRAGEISQILPDMLASAGPAPGTTAPVPIPPAAGGYRAAALVEQLISHAKIPVAIYQGQTYEILAAADIALVASGTATLETALLGTPMVIIYRVASLTFAVARLLVRVPHIGMANLLAEEELFPELIQGDVTPARITAAVLQIITGPGPPGPHQRRAQKNQAATGRSRRLTRAAAVALELLGLSNTSKN